MGIGNGTRGGAQDAAGLIRGALPRQAAIAALGSLGLWLLLSRIGDIDTAAIVATFRGTPWHAWLAAVLLTTVSFRAVGRYDALVQAEMGLPTTARAARRAGAAAIAAAQVLGFGLVSGAIVRWRLLPRLGLATATRVTLAVAVSFLSAGAVLLLVSLAFLPTAPGVPGWAAPLAGAGLAALTAGLWVGRRRFLPLLPFAARLLALTAVDTLSAALALWLLLPPGIEVSFSAFVAVYLLALGAALLAGLPGGLGAFETVLLNAFPGAEAAEIFAAILAFRAVYYALPAVWAGAILWRGPRGATRVSSLGPRAARRILRRAPWAEAGLAHQPGHAILPLRGAASGWVTARAGSTLVAIGDPLGRSEGVEPLGALVRRARERALRPCLYKVGARTAVSARRAGWAVLPVAEELWLDPRRWTQAGHGLARLRRKLRRAEAAGVAFRHCAPGDPLPFGQMARVALDWAACHGGERGFSMGRFDARYLRHQRVILATRGARLVAFASFHVGAQEWTLDLMRHEASAPDGTMQALVAAGIAAAREAGIPRLSLAAVPARGSGALPLRWLQDRVARRADGLRQFKAAFAPRSEPLYIAVAHPGALLPAVADLAWAIRFPRPLPPVRASGRMHGIQDLRDHDEFATRAPSWHIGGKPAVIAAAARERHPDERSPLPPA
ncbi:phosphatidylglycerol lysyltransferase domain-containing protein [Albidovulum sediminicola]|uniref:Phosphatidylglycerol lysyltransferase domain-containing protein n=1 Tax=Albidovulum sediminicola TaxID=2984331 RepID=A0ABT2YZ50_9RHOB|nr:phosphatidylglycerol lysyltransferase domain-containing protein [Defluviimonas sp. WL0075]MCV2864165.1 phosphatidylglycerol lysyltransferase domain-containing protein [Defluviimonas sp. WL0075]